MFKKRAVSVVNKRKLAPLSDGIGSDSGSEEAEGPVSKENIQKFKRLKKVGFDRKNVSEEEVVGDSPRGIDRAASKNSDDAIGIAANRSDSDHAEKKAEPAKDIQCLNGYTKFFNPAKNPSGDGNGPKPLSKNIKTTMIVDYQPDVCKDFKQTGYCGYGDTCKFLHLRDDVKKGWKLDKEWENVGKSKIPESTLERIPFKCPICKEEYKVPIVTPCNHYFCRSCYLKNYRDKKSCFICHKNTGGSMLIAKDLQDLLARQADVL